MPRSIVSQSTFMIQVSSRRHATFFVTSSLPPLVTTSLRHPSFHLRPRHLNELAILVVVYLQLAVHLVGRGRPWIERLAHQLLLYIALRKRFVDLAVEAINDRLWRSRGCEHGDPGRHLVTRHARLRDRRHAGQALRRLGRGDAQRFELATTNLIDHR